MKLIVAGSRNYIYNEKHYNFLFGLKDKISEIVSGGCRGADRFGELFASDYNIPIKYFMAEWNRYGKSAGPVRNGKMARYADACLILPGGGKGSNNMLKQAKENNLIIYKIMEKIK